MKTGFTKAWRKELCGDIWQMSPLHQRVFYYLRQKAIWQSTTFPTRRKFEIALNPGQLITSLTNIAEGVCWYEYGVKKVPNKKIIKDILGWLEGNAMVTVFSNRFGTFIIIINWDTYNALEKEEVTQNNQDLVTLKKRYVDTIKELEEVKKKLKKEPKEKDLKTYCAKFELFWNAYPKKKSKAPAEKAFLKLNPNKELREIILIKIEEAKNSDDWLKENGQYIPYPATWLNARGWEDEIKTATSNASRWNEVREKYGN